MQILIFLYVFSIVYLVINKHIFYALTVFASIPLVIIAYLFIKRYKIRHVLKLIEHARKTLNEGREPKPFINVNNAPIYILELIPGFHKNYAIKLSNKQKHGFKLSNFIEFANFCELDTVYYKICKSILKF